MAASQSKFLPLSDRNQQANYAPGPPQFTGLRERRDTGKMAPLFKLGTLLKTARRGPPQDD